MKDNKQVQVDGKFIGMVAVLFLIFSSVWFGIYYLYTAPEIVNYRSKVESSEKSVVSIQRDYLRDSISDVSNDLVYFSHSKLMTDFLNADSLEVDETKNILGDELRRMAEVHPVYDQVRVIDVNGMEVIRVNNMASEGTQLVPSSRLQDKSDRYYFTETMKMNTGEVYQSRLDLNVENGKVEFPYKPMIRFGIKLMDEEGINQGILVINYNASGLLELFEKFSLNSEGNSYLIDAEGNYLAGLASNNFSFMFEEKDEKTFAEASQEEWETINLKVHDYDTLQFYDEGGLHTASEVALTHGVLHEAHWFVISDIYRTESPYVSDETILTSVALGYLKAWYICIPLLLVSILVTILLRQRAARLAEIRKMAQIDMMTHTFNREAGLQMVRNQLEYAINNVMDYSVCFIDLNDLKKVNDTLGHEAGDDYIMKSIDIIRSSYRDSDQIIRMGGDEFLIGLHASRAVVEKNWQQVLAKVEAFNSLPKSPYTIALSHGVASVQEDSLHQIDELIAHADSRMYEEKRRMKGQI